MSPTEQAAAIELTPERVAAWLDEPSPPQLVDVREPYEREAGHIEDTAHIPLAELTARADGLDRERPLIFYCRAGSRSQMAAQAFRAGGFEAYTMTGGLLRWAGEGRPLVPADGRVADH
ncbi:MAG TPA: rhodanese-like domain-containing protein [Solirubrobacteraceae bacterium]|jgi:hydroxyacylglutathione hydrolase/adenylyltransferase/sulfurtransferase|nr:rhodanese-like domain-containing protein [Solirubrobacteraceae bacterium]